MSEQTSKEIRSTVTSDGDITISIVNVPMPIPKENEVLIKVEASPINPSDLALLTTFAADLDSLTVTGSGDDTVASMRVRPALMKAPFRMNP
jgi:NADPH2:quinone reductase